MPVEESSYASADEFQEVENQLVPDEEPNTPPVSFDPSLSAEPSEPQPIHYLLARESHTNRLFEVIDQYDAQVSQLQQQLAMATTPMPLSSDRHAPTFDPAQPRTLSRYFQNLEELFTRAAIAADADKKSYATRYVPIEVSDQWDTLSGYETGTYDAWKAQVFALYPGADATVRYTRQGLLDYVQQWRTRGFKTLGDWAEFFRNYRTQAAWLVAHGKISDIDRNRWCEDAIGTQMSTISTRLQVKHPDTHPGDGYGMDALDEAMRFHLQGTPTVLSAPAAAPVTLATPIPSTSSTTETTIKIEDVAKLFEYLGRMASSSAANAPVPRPPTPSSANMGCHYDGKPDCRTHNCPAAAEDLAAGRIRRNAENKIVLPNGTFVPRNLPGETMRDRVFEWHRRNPGQLAAGSLSYTAVPDPAGSMLVELVNGTSYDGQAASYVYHRDDEERIFALEQELFNLRNKTRFDAVRVPPMSDKYRRQRTPAPTNRTPAPEPASQTEHTEPSSSKAASASQQPATAPEPTREEPSKEPAEHPLAGVRDATYIPPTSKNVGAPPKASTRDPAFRTAAPVESTETAVKVLNRALKEGSLMITPEELLAISPDVRYNLRSLITPKRLPTAQPTAPSATYLNEQEEVCLPSPEVLTSQGDLPRGVYRIADPYEAYLRALPPGEEPRPVKVANESGSLRTIRALVANSEEVDCILDPGCQIVACSEAVCHELGLSYDPTVVLHMQSANGGVDRSLGLARNIPFAIGDMVFYLQVHVIREAAYDILLGRPFDILASTVVRNYKNEDQTITLTCPNTGRCVTIPTLPRGKPKFRLTEQGF